MSFNEYFSQKHGNSKLRQDHIRLVLNEMRVSSPTTRVNLVQSTGLSKPTITRVVDELLQLGYVLQTGAVDSRIGRKATNLELNPDAVFCIGLNLTKNHIYGSVVDLRMNVRHNNTWPLVGIQSGAIFQELIVKAIRQLIEQSKIDQNRIIGVGLGVPGLVDYNSGIIRRLDIKHKLYEIDIKSAVESELKLHLMVDNNANTRALGEYWYGWGAELKSSNLICILASEGVGAGIICDGQLVRGKSNQTGELGETVVQLHQTGQRGWLEDICTPDAIERETGLSYADACLRVDTDPLVQKSFDQAARALGAGTANLVSLLDPEVVVMSGKMFEGWTGFYDRVLTHCTEFAPFCKQVSFYCRGTRDTLYEVGASALIYKAFFND